jgi:hypothetical protein
MKPRSFMAGLDFQDCFFHWKVHADSRRWLGLRHPITGCLGVFLFVPFGLGPAPGINDRNVAEVIRVAKNHVSEVEVTAFVDDLRLFNPSALELSEADDCKLLTLKLLEFKDICEVMGMSVHSKPGKLIWPTQSISWLGWEVSSVTMKITMQPEKITKGITLVYDLLQRATNNIPIKAKEAMATWGFLNFIAAILKQAQPFGRELGRCIVEAQVFQAWSSGRRHYNPVITLSPLAQSDLLWWLQMFSLDPYRQIHHISGVSFIWHSKLPNLDSFRMQAWNAGLLVILGLDASSSIGWGATMGEHQIQGRWSPEESNLHINWKELKAYHLALEQWGQLSAHKIIFVKSDNAAAIHYINSGRGRMAPLSTLAKQIRLLEVQLSIESVAIHVPGKLNVTPDALSRFFVDTAFRDKCPHRTLRKRLFLMIMRENNLTFTLDGMVADDGHNALVPRFCTPSNPFFEESLVDEVIWLFPPLDVLGITLKFLVSSKREGIPFSCCVLLPEQSSASWFKYLTHFSSIKRFNPGSDLFRIKSDLGFIRDRPIRSFWRVVRLDSVGR